MILWCDGAHGAAENMRRDAALLEDAAAGSEPVLRLFTFAPAGITLGRAQDPVRELDLARAAADGVEWAVRPTGGRAIFHAQEWTFSLATRLGADDAWAPTPAAAYARTCALLRRALNALGVPVELSPGSPRLGSPRTPGAPAAPCFASSARHELTLGGAKLAGIAQRAVRGALLQQGSVLLGEGHLELADYLPLAPERREAVRAALAASAAHAGTHLPADASLGLLADALAAELPGARRITGGDAPERYTAADGSRSR
jgi:lipoate-protein ligase A